MASLEDVLLPTTVVPRKYSIFLRPDLDKWTFEGTVDIQVTVASPVRIIKVHAFELAIPEAHVVPAGGAKVAATGVDISFVDQTAVLHFARDIPAGEALLHIAFTGVLNDKLAGLYRSSYTLGGVKKTMAVTQFEPTDARRAFPCWDEPAVKAVFQLTVATPVDRVAISNTPVAQTEVGTGPRGEAQKLWRFADTPVMSTYLVALVVGEFDVVAGASDEGVSISVYTLPGKSNQGRFALRVACRALSFFSKTFGVPYPLTKSDLIAIPDFSAGAMENWGLVTYRESALLIDEDQSSLATKKRVARVVCHELSHQWWGNLVTMQWWTHLWLNEGFARYMEFASAHHVFPEWNLWHSFVAEIMTTAHELDAMNSTHAIEVDVKHPAEINEIFDTISYAKGASILRMLFNYITPEVGYAGLHKYLTKFAYKNTVTEDLWECLGAEAGVDVRTLMRSWTALPGFPLVTVTGAPGGGLAVSARRFISAWSAGGGALRWPGDVGAAAGGGDAALWNVPIDVLTASGVARVGILELSGKEGTAAASECARISAALTKDVAGAAWFKLNAGHSSFYYTQYDSAAWRALAGAIAGGAFEFTVEDRVGVLTNAVALFGIGEMALVDYVTVLNSFKGDRALEVVVSLASAVGGLMSLLKFNEEAKAWTLRFGRALFEPLGAWLGWGKVIDGAAGLADTETTSAMRPTVLGMLAGCGHEATVEKALQLFDEHTAGKVAIPADLRLMCYGIAVARRGAPAFDWLWRTFKTNDFSEEQRRCLVACGRATDPALLARLMGYSLSEIRTQDTHFVLSAIGSNAAGRDALLSFMKTNWATILRLFGGGQFLFSSIVGSCTSNFDSKEKADEVLAFFASNPAPAAERKIRQSVETICANAWRRHNVVRDPEWLAALTAVAL